MPLNMVSDSITTESLLAVATSALTLLLAVVYYVWKEKDLPPGPKGLPYLGLWPFLEKNALHLEFGNLAKQFGDVFSFKVTGRLYVCLSSIKNLKEVFVTKADCFGRKVSGYCVVNMILGNAVINQHGEQWRVHRKFFHKTFREFGLVAVRDSLAGPFYDSVNEVIEALRASKGRPTIIAEILTGKCTSMQRMLLGGNGISNERKEEFLREFMVSTQTLVDSSTVFLNGTISRYFILPLLPVYRNAVKSQKNLERILHGIVKEHKESFNEGCIRDVIDAYISERNNLKRKGDPTAEYFTDELLVANLLPFLGDGILAVSAFIASILSMAVQHPEEQEKIYAELIEVLGPERRRPTIEDRAHLPYSKAFLYESMRVVSFIPFFASLECTEETTLEGYRIPKGAVVLVNAWSANHNPETYQDPHVFNPSRFLSDNGKRAAEIPVVFGLGRRYCLGEPLIMMQVFLFVATIIKEFHLKFPDDCDYEKMKLNPEEIKFCAIPRS